MITIHDVAVYTDGLLDEFKSITTPREYVALEYIKLAKRKGDKYTYTLFVYENTLDPPLSVTPVEV